MFGPAKWARAMHGRSCQSDLGSRPPTKSALITRGGTTPTPNDMRRRVRGITRAQEKRDAPDSSASRLKHHRRGSFLPYSRALAFCGSAQLPIGNPVKIVGLRSAIAAHRSRPSVIQCKWSSSFHGEVKRFQIGRDPRCTLSRHAAIDVVSHSISFHLTLQVHFFCQGE